MALKHVIILCIFAACTDLRVQGAISDVDIKAVEDLVKMLSDNMDLYKANLKLKGELVDLGDKSIQLGNEISESYHKDGKVDPAKAEELQQTINESREKGHKYGFDELKAAYSAFRLEGVSFRAGQALDKIKNGS